jgi:hypothetical protein
MMNDESDREETMASQGTESEQERGEVLSHDADEQKARRPYTKPVPRPEGRIQPSLLGSPPGPP